MEGVLYIDYDPPKVRKINPKITKVKSKKSFR